MFQDKMKKTGQMDKNHLTHKMGGAAGCFSILNLVSVVHIYDGDRRIAGSQILFGVQDSEYQE